MASISILGWGYVICNPRGLLLQGGWAADCPELPIEFSRISSDGRLTLVIDNQVGRKVHTRFAWSVRSDVEEAKCDLRVREGCSPVAIKSVGAVDQQTTRSHPRRHKAVGNCPRRRCG